MSLTAFPPQANFGTRAVNGIATPTGWDTVIAAALKATWLNPTVDTYIDLIGLSHGAGYGSSDYVANSWVSKFMTNLAALGFTYGGDFWPPYHSVTPNGWASTWAGTPPWTINNVTNIQWFSGGWGKVFVYTAANVAMPCMTFVIPAGYACTDAEIQYLGLVGGAFDYRVDGGAVQTVAASAGPQRVTGGVLAGLNPANAHTIEIGNFTLGSNVAITGIWTKKRSAGGVHMARFAAPAFELALNWGLKGTDSYAQGGKPAPNRVVKPDDLCLQLQGYTTGTSFTTDALNPNATNFGFPAKPHLLLLECVGNDLINGRGPEAMRGALRRIGHAVRRGRENCSMLYAIPAVGNVSTGGIPYDPSYDTAAGVDNGQNWPIYREVIADFSQSYTCSYADFHYRWSDRGVTLGYQTAVEFHPTNLGHQNIADVLSSVVTLNAR